MNKRIPAGLKSGDSKLTPQQKFQQSVPRKLQSFSAYIQGESLEERQAQLERLDSLCLAASQTNRSGEPNRSGLVNVIARNGEVKTMWGKKYLVVPLEDSK